MRIRFAVWVVLGLAFSLVSRAGAQNWNAPAPDDDGSAALAEQFAALAHQTLRATNAPAAAWQENAALYRAATALKPGEVRFVHALAETYLHLGDGPNALKALKAYLAIKPDDQVAQVQVIDLYLADMQGADAKLKFLHQILNTTALAPEIRSEAAVRAAGLLVGKAQNPEAIKMLDTALALNHVNLAAMRTKFQLTHGANADLQSVMQLLNMLHASPGDPAIGTAIAVQLGQLGLVDQSIAWYTYAGGLYRSTVALPDVQFVHGASTELVISGSVDQANPFLDDYLKENPEDIDAWITRLASSRLALKSTPADAALQKADTEEIRLATNAITNRLQEIRFACGETSAATRPVHADTDVPLGDISNDPALLQKAGAQAAQNYLTTATALVWVDLFFRRDAAAADPLLNVMGQMLSDTDVQLTRLRGWRMFVGGDLAGAATKLSAVANQDPLAGLGLVLMNINDPAKNAEAMALAKQLMSRVPYGPVGAVLACELRPLNVKIEPQGAAGPVMEAMNAFDRSFLGILNNPSAYYIIRAEPLKANYDFGEPVMVRVTLQNVGKDDLAIGSECVLHPDLWFDAFMRGMIEQKIPGAAYDQIGQRFVLKSGQSVSTVTRIDTDELFNAFNQQPNLDITLNAIVVTNPLQVSAGVAKPGPAGQEADLLQMLQRKPTPINGPAALNSLVARLQGGDGGERFRVISVISIYNLILAPQQVKVPQVGKVVEIFNSMIKKACKDPKPAVRAFALYKQAQLSPDAATALAAITQMAQLSSSEDWPSRMLALQAALSGAPTFKEKATELVNSLQNDKDPNVAAYAKAIGDHLAVASTQPAGIPGLPIGPSVPSDQVPGMLAPSPAPAGSGGAGGSAPGAAPVPAPATQP